MKLVSLLLIISAMSVFGEVYTRDDRVGGYLKSDNEGKWGDWSDKSVYCNNGEYARGFYLNVEAPIDGDDTAADSFTLLCGYPLKFAVTDNWLDTIYGEWAYILCPEGEHIKGFKSKVESPGGDDTALNSIRALCTDDSQIETNNGGPWGDWSAYSQCPTGSIVCGYTQRIEKKQGGGDDTALNAVRLWCCDNEKVYSEATGYWANVYSMSGGALVTVELTSGITDYSESEFSETNANSLEQSLSASMSFRYGSVGGEVTAQLTAQQSSSITRSSLHGLITTIEGRISIQCAAGDEAIYQYITSVKETGQNQNDIPFTIKSRDYWCISDNTLKPQCPFIYCADDDCQTCTETLGSSNIMDYYPPNTDNKYFKPQSPELPNENVIYFKISEQNLKILVIALIAMIIICVSIFVFYKIDSNKNKQIVSYNKVENDSC